MIPPKGVPKLRDYLQILGRGWVVVLCATLLSAGLGWFNWTQATPIYEASTTVVIKSVGNATPLDALYGQINAESRVLTYQYLARSPRVTGPTIDQLGLSETTDGLAGLISVAPSTTPVLNVVITGTDPDEVPMIANAVTANMIALSTELAKVDGGGTELMSVDEAGPAKRQGSLKQSLIKATSVGLFASLVLVLAWGLTLGRVLGRGQAARTVEGASQFE